MRVQCVCVCVCVCCGYVVLLLRIDVRCLHLRVGLWVHAGFTAVMSEHVLFCSTFRLSCWLASLFGHMLACLTLLC